MKRLLTMLLIFSCLLGTALADSDMPLLTVSICSQMYHLSPVEIHDAEFTRWVQSLLAVEDPCAPPVVSNADTQYRVTFHETGETYTLWHDDLYNKAAVTQPDGTVHRISTAVPQMMENLFNVFPRFNIPEAHRTLLAEHGWTVAFRAPQMFVQLPQTLAASRTDMTALHFTFADLFLRDAGYDITPYLGKTVLPYVYTLYEQVNRVAWCPEDAEFLADSKTGGVLNSLYAVVLEYDGQIIGAYLIACSWDGSDLMSLGGKTDVDLLAGSSVREYLLSKLPLTEEERALAEKSPEEIIRMYASQHDPMLRPIDVLLQETGTPYGSLYGPLSLRYLLPTGKHAESVSPMKLEDFYEVKLDSGRLYFPEVVLESPETGWKIEYFYNTGF